MPLLDIATAQPCLQNHLGPSRAQTLIHANVLSTKFAFGDEKKLCFAYKSFHFPKKPNFNSSQRGKLLITAVATAEPKSLVRKKYKQKNPLPDVGSGLPTVGDSEEVDARERLRRMRISKANKGNKPWNKGRKHSAETLRKIRERTKIAMQDPKVKMKLSNLGHAQSEETRKKIGVGVRMGWEKRREKLMVQENCYFEWQNMIAEVSRRGFASEVELQWDSYKILGKQLTREWLESVEQRKSMPRPKGSKRAPKSPEQRRKIAAAIAAKWADPEYRERVTSGLAKYHGIPLGAERKPRRKPSGSSQSRARSTVKRKDVDTNSSRCESSNRIERLRLQRSNTPLYKDPSASSKLEMIKNIRAQRAAAESMKTEAIERARLLIAEAEKAAKALEVTATKSPIARASLIETRKLIAEAIQSIESIEASLTSNNECEGYPSAVSAEMASQVKKEEETENRSLDQEEHIKVNGSQTLAPSKNEDFSFCNLTFPDILNGEELVPANSNGYSLPTLNWEILIEQSDSAIQLDQPEVNGNIKCSKNPQPNGTKVHDVEEAIPPPKVKAVTKKWIRGKLVEMTEEA
ncbi:hypothetical protein Dsin_014621 [Dipteronia sinensis]|uniref:Nuclease associated modular domain-containing protein n=1 Tax=Dipteronia sinensis TaxID=43782 RepID=A0AAE0AMC5_9ROSI|nr:hypothetical protein Dsin_014621 [Dipteronia sinensis]